MTAAPTRHVESCPFREVATRWADSRWSKPGTFDLCGTPLVGYVALEGVLDGQLLPSSR